MLRRHEERALNKVPSMAGGATATSGAAVGATSRTATGASIISSGLTGINGEVRVIVLLLFPG